MRTFLLLFVAFLLCACSYQMGQSVAVNNAARIKPGVTDMATVQSLLGPPPMKGTMQDGSEYWGYQNIASSGTPFGADAHSEIIQIFFKRNIVSKCTVLLGITQVHTFSPDQTNNQETPCGTNS
jgi:hypothetical protein